MRCSPGSGPSAGTRTRPSEASQTARRRTPRRSPARARHPRASLSLLASTLKRLLARGKKANSLSRFLHLVSARTRTRSKTLLAAESYLPRVPAALHPSSRCDDGYILSSVPALQLATMQIFVKTRACPPGTRRARPPSHLPDRTRLRRLAFFRVWDLPEPRTRPSPRPRLAGKAGATSSWSSRPTPAAAPDRGGSARDRRPVPRAPSQPLTRPPFPRDRRSHG